MRELHKNCSTGTGCLLMQTSIRPIITHNHSHVVTATISSACKELLFHNLWCELLPPPWGPSMLWSPRIWNSLELTGMNACAFLKRNSVKVLYSVCWIYDFCQHLCMCVCVCLCGTPTQFQASNLPTAAVTPCVFLHLRAKLMMCHNVGGRQRVDSKV